ncbi:MAG TPA: DUF6458 family protein [Solirubrobacteraceae bacterium]|nr:DUF6458 family protein [Solirubrobacteraceae bacterium]
MTFGASLFLVAVGAVLRYAVHASSSTISWPTVGLILMIIGVVGFVLALIEMFVWRPRRGRVLERDLP